MRYRRGGSEMESAKEHDRPTHSHARGRSRPGMNFGTCQKAEWDSSALRPKELAPDGVIT